MSFSKLRTDYLYSVKMDKTIYKEFHSHNEAMDWGIKNYNLWGINYKKVSQRVGQYGATIHSEIPLESYCGNAFMSLNDSLRTNQNDSYNGALAAILIREICGAPLIPNNIIVYRLVCDEVIQEMTTIRNDKPYTYYEKGFMSTSLLKDIVVFDEKYSSHKNLLKIYVNKNTMGVYVNVVARRSEEEMLFLPGMTLGLINKPYQDKNINKTIYECILLGGKAY